MNAVKLATVGTLIACLTGCSWLEENWSAQEPHQTTTEDDDNGPDSVAPDDSNTWDPDRPGNSGSMEQRPAYILHSEPLPERCPGTEFGRCRIGVGLVEPASAAAVDTLMLSEPISNCDDWSTPMVGGIERLNCVYQDVAGFGSDSLTPDNFYGNFVYEIYEDGEDLRIAILEVDQEGRVLPDSLSNDARARWGFDDVRLAEDGDVVATGGLVPVRTDYWGFPIEMTVRDATLHGVARTDREASLLQIAEIRGHIEVVDIHDDMNARASACERREVQDFTPDIRDDHICHDYSRHDDQTCVDYHSYCGFIGLLLDFADYDINEDGLADAFTVRFGAAFTASERRFSR